MENKTGKRKNIFLYFIGMVIVFLILLSAEQIISDIVSGSLMYAKYGMDAIFEIIWAVLVLVVLLLFKNKYVFTQERESFSKSIKYILPELIISALLLVSSISALIVSETSIDIPAIINVLVQCIFIGIVEEFMCRGWLLNEFLERYSDTKKGIVLSIILSSLIFGLIHFLNIGETQGLFDTLVQVLNATASGVFLALVYYKTKNIWVVVFSHTIWDFVIFLGESNQLVDCYVNGAPSTGIIISSIVTGLLCTLGYAFLCYWMYRKTDIYENKDGKNKSKNYLVAIGIVIYIIALFVVSLPDSYSEYYICPAYEEKELSNEYSWTVDLSSEYNLNFEEEKLIDESIEIENYNYLLTSNAKTYEVELKNNNTGYKVSLAKDVIDYLLIENEEDYIILIQTSYYTVLYGRFDKANISNDNSYLDGIKDSLKEFHVPEIAVITTLKENNSNYTYASIKTELNNRLFFEDDELYILK